MRLLTNSELKLMTTMSTYGRVSRIYHRLSGIHQCSISCDNGWSFYDGFSNGSETITEVESTYNALVMTMWEEAARIESEQ